MSEAVMSALISALIAGVFGLIGKRMELARQNLPANPAGQAPVFAPPPAVSVNTGTVLRHVGALQLCVNIIGFLIGMSLGIMGADETSILVMILVFGTMALAVGFVISASLVTRQVRWRHLFWVALGSLLITLLLNSVLLQQPVSSAGLIFGVVQSFSTMALAGVIVNAVKPS